MDEVTIRLVLTEAEAMGLAQLVKRLARRALGKDDLFLVTVEEEPPATAAVLALRESLAAAGYAPR
jgi:hypothetical protein